MQKDYLIELSEIQDYKFKEWDTWPVVKLNSQDNIENYFIPNQRIGSYEEKNAI